MEPTKISHNGYQIVVDYVYPPIPLREFDWCASFEDYDPIGTARQALMGYGPTPESAIEQLVHLAELQLTK